MSHIWMLSSGGVKRGDIEEARPAEKPKQEGVVRSSKKDGGNEQRKRTT
jgi:hypothetical protein